MYFSTEEADMLPFRGVLPDCNQLPHLRQGIVCLGPNCEKVETLLDWQGDHHPYGSSPLAVPSVIDQATTISSFQVDGVPTTISSGNKV